MICFPDINVWIALIVNEHLHHGTATEWYETAEWDTLILSRVTQMGLLRLLTNEHVMGGGVLSAERAWSVVDQLRANPAVRFAPEPLGVEALWRKLTELPQPNSHFWTDAWLAAFALSTGYTLVTFDRRLSRFRKTPLRVLTDKRQLVGERTD
jgi:uncharacterized protein